MILLGAHSNSSQVNDTGISHRRKRKKTDNEITERSRGPSCVISFLGQTPGTLQWLYPEYEWMQSKNSSEVG